MENINTCSNYNSALNNNPNLENNLNFRDDSKLNLNTDFFLPTDEHKDVSEKNLRYNKLLSNITNYCDTLNIAKAREKILSDFKDYIKDLYNIGETPQNINAEIKELITHFNKTFPSEIMENFVEDLFCVKKSVNEFSERDVVLCKFRTIKIIDGILRSTLPLAYDECMACRDICKINNTKYLSNIEIIAVVDFANLNFDNVNFEQVGKYMDKKCFSIFQKRLEIFKDQIYSKNEHVSFVQKILIGDLGLIADVQLVSPKFWNIISGNNFRNNLLYESDYLTINSDYKRLPNHDVHISYGSFYGQDYPIDSVNEIIFNGKYFKISHWILNDEDIFTGNFQNIISASSNDNSSLDEIMKKNFYMFKDALKIKFSDNNQFLLFS